MDRSRNGRKTESSYGDGVRNPRARQRALLIAAGPNDPELAELRELLRTAGVASMGELTQRRPTPDPDTYFGKGKLDELKRALKEQDANLIAVDDELAPRQERNLEEAAGMPVIDRTAIILDIFAGHAHSAEGKLQVELAQLEYNLARMRGLWTHLERLGAGRGVGGIGTRGPGESQIETDRRLARDRISALKRRLEGTKATRRTMRAERERAHLPTVALAGYTNAGKSTLLNALTGADAPVAHRLFHTLDPMTRSFEISGRTYLITDTVGFIRKLPHQLVEAFAATLQETIDADLILHVVDAAAPEMDRHEMIDAVDETLHEIGADERPRMLVMNKVDLLDDEQRRELSFRHPDAAQVSAVSGEGLEELSEAIEARFLASLQTMELLVPYEEGGRLSELHDLAGDMERNDTPEGVRVKARVPAGVAPRFERFSVNGTHDQE
ncbi:MAG: GTPase [Thermoleophilaceae bacterium]|jgi:GTP-binding protein HflX|nr:GTPase [Thermoleophilaceae bacterium]